MKLRQFSKFFMGLGGLAMLAFAPAQASDFIQYKPMNEVVKASVSDCRLSNRVELPMITWGADIVTIHANGTNQVTQRGSLFQDQGLNFALERQDDFSEQVENYMKCKSPYLRGTVGMLAQAVNVTNKDPRTEMVVVYQHSWSNGGDALVVSGGINSASDLKGKSIAVQAYGPHVDYLLTVLRDAGLSSSDVTIKWSKNLSGNNSPADALADGDVDAAMVIIPDALALTSDGTVGTGAEGSVRGATILLSTKSANRVISDVYAVRRDYYESNRNDVEKFVHALMIAEEQVKERFDNDRNLQSTAAKLLLDDSRAIADVQGLWIDAETVGWTGNVKFFTDTAWPRNITNITSSVQAQYVAFGILNQNFNIQVASWDFDSFTNGLKNVTVAERPKFDTAQVQRVVTARAAQGVDTGEIFSFEINFKPNQNDFGVDLYEDAFNRVIEFSETYGGAVVSIEGHSDPLEYLRAKKQGASDTAIRRQLQATKNLSITRAQRVRDAVIGLASGNGLELDTSQFAIVGHGIRDPKTGLCGSEPCAPSTEAEWLSNMRVVVKVINIEAEASAFTPL